MQKPYLKLVVGHALGKAYKSINPDVFYMGVELMSKPAEVAKKHLDFVWNINVEDENLRHNQYSL